MILKAPFPWFGGKSRCAAIAWQALGNPHNYVEPFFGSGAVLLARPHDARLETINDKDGFITNVWRSIQRDPAGVTAFAEGPLHEVDLHARHGWLMGQRTLLEQMLTDPDYYDPKIAGWWLWGVCSWIGDGWCAERGNKSQKIKIPSFNSARGVHRNLEYGSPVDPADKMPFKNVRDWISALSVRLKKTQVACGDWTRVLGAATIGDYPSAVGSGRAPTGIFLDPPYEEGEMEYRSGGVESKLARDVGAWALEHGGNKNLRIVLAGYEGNHDLPGWRCVPWKAKGGYTNQGDGTNTNSGRERLWLSPHCIPEEAGTFGALFSGR